MKDRYNVLFVCTGNSLLLSPRMEALDRLAAETRLRQISEVPTTA